MFKSGEFALLRTEGNHEAYERAQAVDDLVLVSAYVECARASSAREEHAAEDVFRQVVILEGAPKPSKKVPFPVSTSAGVVDESALIPAHRSVLRNSEMVEPEPREKANVAEFLAKSVPWELVDKVRDLVKGASLDFNGHWKNGTLFESLADVLDQIMIHSTSIPKEDVNDILGGVDRWVPLDIYLPSFVASCSMCGEKDLHLEVNGNGNRVRFAGAPCPYPNGLPLTEWELNVPSGKLVVANDLRHVFPLPEGDDFDINTIRGCIETSLVYAANGMSHAYVGNTCPAVYKYGEDRFKVATAPSKVVWDEKKEKYVKVDPKILFEGKKVASICTDLWWYSICDHAEFKRRCKHFKVDEKDFHTKVVKVKPGVYRFYNDDLARMDDDGPKEKIYTRFKWIRDPDPVKDYLALYHEVEVNPHAYVQAKVARWPTLYGTGRKVPWSSFTEEEKLHTWQRVADHTFCTIGGGVEWHEKGFPQASVDSSILDEEPPSFRAQFPWYPFSKPYGGLFQETLSPSFAKLAFRVLESVISFGSQVHDSATSRDVPYVRERMLVAVNRYRELAKKYPEQADPEYVTWLSQEGRAEAWVKNFPLGPTFTEKHEETAKRQRWVPDDAYAIVFDARVLDGGDFAHKHGWSSKEEATAYTFTEWSDNKRVDPRLNCFWSTNAVRNAVPLYSVARVTKLGTVSHMGQTIIEVAFDYGTPWMRSDARKGIPEFALKDAIKVVTKEEYEKLLPDAIGFFEGKVDVPVEKVEKKKKMNLRERVLAKLGQPR